jgi:hypothetical protein
MLPSSSLIKINFLILIEYFHGIFGTGLTCKSVEDVGLLEKVSGGRTAVRVLIKLVDLLVLSINVLLKQGLEFY